MTRKAVVAGQFYPGNALGLDKEISSLMDPSAKKYSAVAIIAPHAGYVYSGEVAGSVYASIETSSSAVIIGPNHTGYGERFSLMSTDSWITPLGEVGIDKKLAKAILGSSQLIKEDSLAHMAEHSVEVQLPFLQKLNPKIKIVPIIVSGADVETYIEIGKGIADSIKSSDSKILIVASSDMTHYESQESAARKDSKAIEALLKLDETELIKRVKKYEISMCGYAPVAITLAASKALGAKKAELIKYQTSGEVSGDYTSVVGYAGIVIY